MLWFCSYEALPGVRPGALGRAFLRQHDAGTNAPTALRGWYTFPTGTSGVVFLEADTPHELTRTLEPYAGLVTWSVQAAAELNYNQVLEEQRRSRGKAAQEDHLAGLQVVQTPP